MKGNFRWSRKQIIWKFLIPYGVPQPTKPQDLFTDIRGKNVVELVNGDISNSYGFI